MKRKLLFSFSLVCMLVIGAFAQDRKITGKVTSSEDNSPLPGVSVQIKGTKSGVQTNLNGEYAVTVPDGGGLLVFSFIGFQNKEIVFSNQTRIDVALDNDEKQLSEVVVTAFGISKAQKAIGYSAERIDAAKLQQKAEPDVLRSLTNKIAGVNIVGSNGIAGSATKITIRGTNTLFGNSQPLFVVDGIPYDNSETTGGLDTRLSSGNGAYSNRAADIDPNNIESMTVLKGGAAAALYGSRASNGVILITTKTGTTRKSQKGLEVSFSSSYSNEEISGLPNYQNLYGTGSNNVFANANGSWGAAFKAIPDTVATWSAVAAIPGQPARVPYKAYPNNVKDFFRRGNLFENSLSITGGAGSKTTMSAVVSYSKNNSYIPNNEFNRFNVSVGATTKLDNKLTITSTVAYNNTSQAGPLLGGDNASSLFARTLYMGRSWPLQDAPYINPATNASVFFVAAAQADNPRWSVENNSYTSNVDRVNGSLSLNYPITKWLSANYKAGVNTYTDGRQTTVRPGSAGGGGVGEIRIDNIRFREIESNLFLSGSKDVNDKLNLSYSLGYNYNQRENFRNAVTGTQILFFGIDNINLTNAQQKNSNITPFTKRRLHGAYTDITVGFRNSIFANFTARNDWSSTLPASKRSYFYPSGSLSWNFTDDIPSFKNSDILNAGKLRFSVSRVGRDANVYSLFSTYDINPNLVQPASQSGSSFPFRGIAGASLEETTYDPNLKPEFTTEFEGGTELWFYQKRAGIDFTLYNRISTNLIAPIQIAYATGFRENYTNLGQISNKGVELGLTLVPVRKKGFEWEIYTTYTRNRSNIDELLEGDYQDVDNQIILGNTYAGSVQAIFRKNQPYGVLLGTKAARDDQGNFLINPATGLLIEDPTPQIIGDPNPDYILGITNTFTYKGLSLSAVIGYTHGGDVYSSTTSLQLGRGVTRDTEKRDVPLVVPGVIGDPNTFKPVLVDGRTVPANIQVPVNDIYFQSSGNGSFGTNSPDEFSVWDATTIRLREINLGYTIPSNYLKKTPFGSATISFNGRNLFYKAVNFPIHSNFDPEISTYGTGNVSGIEFSSAPSTRRFGASIRFTF
ncbi:MAG: SusC/RagA family TonB-linked outer membrane protein [Leadbetterella sp.]